MTLTKRLSVVVVSLLTLAGCKGAGRSAQTVGASAITNLGCKTAESEMWNSLQRVAEDGQAYPSADEIHAALLDYGKLRGLSGPAFENYVQAFTAHYSVIIGGIQQKFGPTDTLAWRKALSEMEIGIRVTTLHAELDDQIEASQITLSSAEHQLDATCNQPNNGRAPAGELDPQVTPPTDNPKSTPPPTTVWEELKADSAAEIYGARRVMATAYQSCDVLSLKPISAATGSVTGVAQDAKKNPINGGILRHYGDLNAIDNSHYYIHNMSQPNNSCAAVKNHPPIYDFGGKPYTTSTLATTLNMQRADGGSGSEVFGVDCSGFVFSSLVSAGLHIVDPGKDIKATMVLGTPAAAFKEPQSNHLGCMAKIAITSTQTLQPGDVIATTGHVIMVDTVGADPFGIAKAKTASDCSKLTYGGFDFSVTQSSPSKGSIGINRYVAKDYLATSGTMASGLTAYAQALCRTKFGLAASLNSPNMSVVRHKKTPECRMPEFTLTGQECVSACPVL